jgi:hypothetical protein
VELEKQPSLSFRDFYGRGTQLIVIHHVIDSSAYGIAAHQPGIKGLQQFGRYAHILHLRIEPQVVTACSRTTGMRSWTAEGTASAAVVRIEPRLQRIAVPTPPAFPDSGERKQFTN